MLFAAGLYNERKLHFSGPILQLHHLLSAIGVTVLVTGIFAKCMYFQCEELLLFHFVSDILVS